MKSWRYIVFIFIAFCIQSCSSQDINITKASLLRKRIGEYHAQQVLASLFREKASSLQTQSAKPSPHQPTQDHLCPYPGCNHTFSNENALTGHLLDHMGDNPRQCPICQKTFTVKNGLRLHLRTHTNYRPHGCPVCFISFSQAGDLKRHMRIHTGEKSHICPVCQKSFARKWSLQSHQKTCKNVEVAATNTLAPQQEQFSSTSSFQSAQRHACMHPHCVQTFEEKGALTEHLHEHIKNNSLQCPICQNLYANRSSLGSHMHTHTGHKPFACSFCPKKFAQKGTLKKHMLTHNKKRPYICSICNRPFARKSTLTQHIRIHTGEKPYTCPTVLPPGPVLLLAEQPALDTSPAIRESFQETADVIALLTRPDPARSIISPLSNRRIEGLTSLESAATDISAQLASEPATDSSPLQPAEQIECQFPSCSQTFAQRSSLTNHLREHVGNNPYQCPICQKISPNRSKFSRHLRIHSREKPYTCPACNKSFAHNNTLTNHMRIHTGEKPYICPTCNQSFARKDTLTNHMRIHTGEKPHACPVMP